MNNEETILEILDSLSNLHQYFDAIEDYEKADNIEKALKNVESCFPKLCGGKN